jgi:hypothetical protein
MRPIRSSEFAGNINPRSGLLQQFLFHAIKNRPDVPDVIPSEQGEPPWMNYERLQRLAVVGHVAVAKLSIRDGNDKWAFGTDVTDPCDTDCHAKPPSAGRLMHPAELAG